MMFKTNSFDQWEAYVKGLGYSIKDGKYHRLYAYDGDIKMGTWDPEYPGGGLGWVKTRLDIDEIMNYPIAGNAYNDGTLMDAIHLYVQNPGNDMDNRRKALSRLDDVMGVSCDYPTENDVHHYLKEVFREV